MSAPALDLTEAEQLRRLARQFVDARLIPLERQVDDHGLDESTWANLVDECVELGLTGLRFPTEYGGGGAGLLATCIVLREFGRTAHSFFQRLLLPVDYALMFGTAEQKERYLRRGIQGEVVCAFGLTEPEAGSNAADVATIAERRDCGWVINGHKVFTTLARSAHLVVTIAATGTRPDGRRELTAFLVPTDTPGFRLGAENDKVGFRGVTQSDTFFDHCFVGNDAVLGEVGQAWQIVTSWTSHERLCAASWCLGSAERALELAIDYANTRDTFGAPLASRQAIQWMIADSTIELAAVRDMIGVAARRSDAGEEVTVQSAAIKVFSAEVAGRVIDRAQQVHGGMGYMRDLPFDMLARDVRLARIGGGTSEMMRLIVSRDALRGQGRRPGDLAL